jgi:peptide/histidine transporter 3/4
MEGEVNQNVSLLRRNKRPSWRCRYKLQRISSKAAILVLSWDIGLSIYICAAKMIIINLMNHTYVNEFSALLFPVASGIVADAWLGRHRMLTGSIVIGVIAWIMLGLSIIFNHLAAIIPAILSVLMASALFRANILPFNIDQLTGEASSNQLTSVVHWHFFGSTSGLIIMLLLDYLIAHHYNDLYWYIPTTDNSYIYLYVITGLVFLYVVLTYIFLNKWLDVTMTINNPISLIAGVLNYARKHKYPENRSALTYWEDESPSRLDLGKRKYGGPFTEEEVENVKVSLRLFPLILCMAVYGSTWDVQWDVVSNGNLAGGHIEFLHHSIGYDANDKVTFLSSYACFFLTVVFLIFLCQFLVYPCFDKFIPSMLKRIGIGFALTLVINLTYLIMMVIPQYDGAIDDGCVFTNETFSLNFDYRFHYIPLVLYGVSYFLVQVTSLEFILAQSPQSMRSTMIGLWYGAGGLMTAANCFLYWPFARINLIPLGCGFYYILTKCLISLTLVISFTLLARWYKLRGSVISPVNEGRRNYTINTRITENNNNLEDY